MKLVALSTVDWSCYFLMERRYWDVFKAAICEHVISEMETPSGMCHILRNCLALLSAAVIPDNRLNGPQSSAADGGVQETVQSSWLLSKA
jgi:hypothetical protein